MLSRRSLIAAVPALICAPAIVRASSLMPVRAWREASPFARYAWAYDDWRIASHRTALFAANVRRNNALLTRLREFAIPTMDYVQIERNDLWNADYENHGAGEPY